MNQPVIKGLIGSAGVLSSGCAFALPVTMHSRESSTYDSKQLSRGGAVRN